MAEGLPVGDPVAIVEVRETRVRVGGYTRPQRLFCTGDARGPKACRLAAGAALDQLRGQREWPAPRLTGYFDDVERV